MTVKFKFEIGDKVETTFGAFGIVESANKNQDGITYWVETGNKETSRWYKEEYLKLQEENDQALLPELAG